jgi:hypothetical protein
MRNWYALSAIAAAALMCLALVAQPPAVNAQDSPFTSAQSVVEELYRLVTFDPGQTPDWNQVRALFIDEAVIVLRTGRTKTSVFSVEGFVADFVAFIQRANVEETGFTERIIRSKSLQFGDIAHILVLYEALIPGSQREPHPGVDSFQLIRKNGRWWIASVVNEIPTEDRPVPAELQE